MSLGIQLWAHFATGRISEQRIFVRSLLNRRTLKRHVNEMRRISVRWPFLNTLLLCLSNCSVPIASYEIKNRREDFLSARLRDISFFELSLGKCRDTLYRSGGIQVNGPLTVSTPVSREIFPRGRGARPRIYLQSDCYFSFLVAQ